MKDVTKELETVISSLNAAYEFDTVTASGSDFICTIKNTYWLRQDKKITLAGKEYIIKSVALNQSILLTPVGHVISPPAKTQFNLINPIYKHGTAIAINNELGQINDEIGKFPLVWLYEIFDFEVDKNAISPVEVIAPVRLFIFDVTNPENFLTEDHYHVVIRPLQQLSEKIVDHINSNLCAYGEIKKFRITGLPDWGQFNEMKGFTTRILDEKISGLELRFDFVLKK